MFNCKVPAFQDRKVVCSRDLGAKCDFLPYLYEKCIDAGIQFSCTPFYLEAVEELEPYVSFYKIASYEILWKDLLIACARTKKPVVLSTGMATLEEIGDAVDTLKGAGCEDLTLLHCVSAYPTPIAECNLAAIQTLRQHFDCKVGWSDHSVSPAVIYRAVHRWGATMVEFHLDLEGKGEEYSIGHCWLPYQIEDVIKNVNFGLGADGTGEKKVRPSEMADRPWRRDPRDGLRPFLSVRVRT